MPGMEVEGGTALGGGGMVASPCPDRGVAKAPAGIAQHPMAQACNPRPPAGVTCLIRVVATELSACLRRPAEHARHDARVAKVV